MPQTQHPAAERQRQRALRGASEGPAQQPHMEVLLAVTSTEKTTRHMENSTDLFSRGVQLLETTEYQFSVCSDCRNINCFLKWVYL